MPLSPGDVYDEQVRMKTERDKQRKEMKSSQETNEIETREPKPEAMGGSKGAANNKEIVRIESKAERTKGRTRKPLRKV